MRYSRGFTLIEVLISLMILSMALVTLSGGEGLALNSTRKSRFVTMATIAARNLMSEIDIMVDIKGFEYVKELGEKTEDTFDEDEYKGWKWMREVKEVEFPLSAIMNAYSASESSDVDEVQSPQEQQILGLIATNVEKLMKEAIREITITVYWPVRAGKAFSNLKLVYYVVNFETVENFVPML